MNWFKRKMVEIAEEAIERWANTKFPEWFATHKEVIFNYLEKEVDDFESILVLKWKDGVPPAKEAVQDVIDTLKYVVLHGRFSREEEVEEVEEIEEG